MRPGTRRSCACAPRGTSLIGARPQVIVDWLASMRYMPHSNASTHAPTAPSPHSHLGWPSPRCWSAGVGGTPYRTAPTTRGSRPSLPRARHPSCDIGSPLPARRPHDGRNSSGVRGARDTGLPRPALQRAARSPASPRRGGCRLAVYARGPGPRDPIGQGDQPRHRSARTRLGRSLPRAAAADAARSASRARLRPEQRAQASTSRARARSVLVGGMVRRMGCHAGAADRPGSGRAAPDLACAPRLAAAGPHRRSRGPECGASSSESVVTRRRLGA